MPSEAPPAIPTFDALNRLASVIISLEALAERKNDTQEALTGFAPKPTFSYMNTMSNRVDRGGLARIEWRKKSGKVQYATEGFYLGSKGLIIVAASQLTGEEPEPEVDMDESIAQPDPTANLSFNLSLTDNQRRAKDNVELPFMKVQQEPTGTSGGHIYYQPDAGDDFDDEDPDDDLDIETCRYNMTRMWNKREIKHNVMLPICTFSPSLKSIFLFFGSGCACLINCWERRGSIKSTVL